MYTQISDIIERKIENYYGALVILHINNAFLLLCKISDFMDDETLKKIEEDKRIDEEINQRICTEKENQRLLEIELTRKREEERMGNEEIIIRNYVKYLECLRINEGNTMKKEENFMIKFMKSEKIAQRKENGFMKIEDGLMRNFLRVFGERAIAESIKKLEMEKIAEKQRLEIDKRLKRQRSLRDKKRQLETEVLEKSEIKDDSESKSDKEIKNDLESSPLFYLNSPTLINESPASIDSLLIESKMLSSLILVCGSYFCSQCYRMLKRSSLFLKCSNCCDKAFTKLLPRSQNTERKKIPPNSICISCSNSIIKGEIVLCICCYIRDEFLKDYSDSNCKACGDPESIIWVDTYIGMRYELVKCGFCTRSVNFLYVIEVCSNCHDQVCLHCLRKNSFIAESVCNECHNRRVISPIKKKGRISE